LRRDMDYTGVNQPSERKRTTMPNQQTHFNMHLKVSRHITRITNLRYNQAVLDREIHKLDIDHYGHQQFSEMRCNR
jgi:hypothetical protein